MRSRRIFKAALVLLIVLSACSFAFADAYHYRNILVGERASGLGGAYTAISDDPSGLYYNPAGIVYSQGNNLSASANAYHSTTKKYKNAIGSNAWTRKASALLPNFFGVVQSLGGGKVGLSYVVPDSIIEDQDQVFTGIPSAVDTDGDGVAETPSTIDHFAISFNNEDTTLNFGPTYAREITEDVSAGLTLYAHQRKNQWILNQLIVHDTGHFEWVNTYYETEEWGVKPILGIMVSPIDKTSIGLSLSKVYVLDSETSRIETRKPSYANTATRQEVNDTGRRKYPTTATLGMAYFPSESLLLSGDVSYYSSEEDRFLGKREAIWNFALGTEYYTTESTALRAGVFTNFSSAPDLSTTRSGQPEHIDLYGGSLSMSYFGHGASLTLGGSYSYGTGDAQVVERSTSLQDETMYSWTIFLATSYSY